MTHTFVNHKNRLIFVIFINISILICIFNIGGYSQMIPQMKFFRKKSQIAYQYRNSDISRQRGSDCDELIRLVENKLTRRRTSLPFTLSSSWLYQVEAYDYEGKVIVIAEIRTEGQLYPKKYIFCNVPVENWNYFEDPWKGGLSKTYGEKFHEAIIDYKCDCE